MKLPASVCFSLVPATLALLAGCAPQNGTGTLPQGAKVQSSAPTAPGAGDLLYALAPRGRRNAGRVFILTYPGGNYVSHFDAPIKAELNGTCSDAKGDVFITQYVRQGYIYEYSHGATKPSATLTLDSSDVPAGCAVDEANGDLAVVFGSGTPGVAIFHHASGTPQYYTFGQSSSAGEAAFDASGNLFAVFLNSSGANVFELPRRSKTWRQLQFDVYMNAYSLQWDGKYLAVAIFDQHARWLIYRVKVSHSRGHIVSTIYFDGLGHSIGSFWIQKHTILVPISKRSKKGKVALYHYPQGGSPEGIITGYKVSRLTVSVAP